MLGMLLCKVGAHIMTEPHTVLPGQEWPPFWASLNFPESYKDGKVIYRYCVNCGRVETSMRCQINWHYGGFNMDGNQRVVS
jgi:hypothetical protein